MAAWTSMLVGFALSVGLPTEDGIQQVSADCAAPVNMTCGPVCSPCSNGSCDSCCYDCCRSCKHCGWLCRKIYFCKLHSTCDMIPHYAPPSENQGYYYFLPYNYTHVDEARGTVPGRDLKYPFSTEPIDKLLTDAGPERTRADDASSDMIRPRRQQLQSIERVLETK